MVEGLTQLNHRQLDHALPDSFPAETTTLPTCELTVNKTQFSRADEGRPRLAEERIQTWYLAIQCRHCSSVLLLCWESFFFSLSPLSFARSRLKTKERDMLTSLSVRFGCVRRLSGFGEDARQWAYSRVQKFNMYCRHSHKITYTLRVSNFRMVSAQNILGKHNKYIFPKIQ